MNILSYITKYLSPYINIDNEYLLLIIISIIYLLLLKLMNILITKSYKLKKHSSRKIFKFTQHNNLIFNILAVIGLFIIWESHLKGLVTIISFISAGATIALKEVVLNYFAGIYIRSSKPFVLEDRIEIDGIIGDVVLIKPFNFKVLQVGNKETHHQSNGIIINIPNSFIFSYSLKNYTTAFKYIWTELHVPIKLDADIVKNKKLLSKIVNSNEIIKTIPKKMDRQIDAAAKDYRIYYNKLEPVIYTSFDTDHIDLAIRYLVHPKKERIVEDQLWNEILKYNKDKKIDLYTGSN